MSAEAKSRRGWNPRIVVFACNWCSYAGGDTAVWLETTGGVGPYYTRWVTPDSISTITMRQPPTGMRCCTASRRPSGDILSCVY